MQTQQSKACHWVMDYETLVNCFIGVFEHYKDDDIAEVFIINKDQNDFPKLLAFLQTCAEKGQWHISFNGLAFDAQISEKIIRERQMLSGMTGEQVATWLYGYAQDVINRKNTNSFAEFSPKKLKIKQIDLFKLNHWDNKAKMSSLKWIQYSMDWFNVEEMPHHHTTPVTSKEQLQEIVSYCINDVRSTKKVLNLSKEQIALRKLLTKDYGIDLYSASEPRISKELFLHFLSKKLGMEKNDIRDMRTPRTHIVLADCILPYVKFTTPNFQKLHDFFKKTVITSTKDGFKYSVTNRGVKTDYGLGGIHGAAEMGVYEAKPGWVIMTSDVTSYYPNLAIRNGFHPEHINQKAFCEQYEWFFDERVKIPKSDPKNYVYKIILNSTYGLSGDENSFLYDPKFTMQITVNGQLLLSMLYEMLLEAIPDARPLMQNTDGLEMMIPMNDASKYMAICHQWELLTKLQLEHDEYTKMIIGDVNNYMAVNKKGKVKCKGRFEWEDLDKKAVATLHKNKSFLIIPKAIHAYFIHGTKPEDFLAANQNIFDYCAGVKAKGDWWYEGRDFINNQEVKHKLKKIVRYYVSKQGTKLLKCHNDGREMQVEAGKWRQVVMNELVNKPFQDYNIDMSYYLESIYKEINQIEKVKSRDCTQLSLF